MTTATDNRDAKPNRHLSAVLAASAAVLIIVALAAAWRNYQLATDHSWLSQFSRAAAGLLPPSWQSAAAEQAQAMGLPLAAGSKAYWYMARAGGVLSYILLWLATCWGIMMSSKIIKGLVDVPVAYALHEYLPILGVVFAALHALVLLGDSYIAFKPWQILVPFASPYKPFWTGLGVLAFYLSIALIASFYVRKRIGQKTWRALHYTSYLAFLIALLHGVMAGSDSGTTTMRALYLVTGATSIFLLLYRLLAYAPRPARTAAAVRLAAVPRAAGASRAGATAADNEA